MLQIPIFHVNGEQPESVCRVIELAMEFRRKWGRDVVVDMYCYRRRGHMEQDDPSITQPLLHQAIDARPPIVRRYTENLIKLGNVTGEDADEISRDARQRLADELEKAKASDSPAEPKRVQERDAESVETAVPVDRLKQLLRILASVREGFTPHPKIKALLRRRQGMADGKQAVDWATAEALAYATLLTSGHGVRISGEDSERGTFAHRHAVLHDTVTGERYVSLNHLDGQQQGRFIVCNSPLTETAVMAFEFGYSIEQPGSLVVWEAQFGDFANVAQVVIDQFVTSSESKWRQPSGLILLLPHGLEGQGPEHSSARPERFLQLCANGNVEVVHLTTASQVFHRLRQQALSSVKRPLIAFIPKRFIHGNFGSCALEDLARGGFQPVVVDPGSVSPERLLLCSGQVAAALSAERTKREEAAGILRMDQLYPLPVEALQAALRGYPEELPLTWVQEEPENMGAWRWIRPQLEAMLPGREVRCVARPERASPASGSVAAHDREQSTLLNQAFE